MSNANKKKRRDGPSSVGERVTGVMMQYYEMFTRELWFAAHDADINRGNRHVMRGTRVDNTSYAENRESLQIHGTIAPDPRRLKFILATGRRTARRRQTRPTRAPRPP